MAIPKLKPLSEASEGTKKILKPLLLVVGAILLGAFGLELSNTDFDLGKILQGQGIEASKVVRDDSGNVIYDKQGNVVTDSTKGKKADEYNCDDFSNREEAQAFFKNVGGAKNDLNRLDGDKDGEACESLPKAK
jgi:hypothetical protein